jgi:hypothetical protein
LAALGVLTIVPGCIHSFLPDGGAGTIAGLDPLVLVLVLLERGLHAVHAWAGAARPGGHHPPEHYAVLVVLPLVTGALWLSQGDRRSSDAPRVR